MVKELSLRFSYFAEIWYACALVRDSVEPAPAENDWLKGRPQVAVQR